MATGGRPFGRWHLRGGRYEQHGLPVEMLSEFARYERLVVDVAKAIYKNRHARRQRVPRGFASGFELRLTEIHAGSVVPVLEVPDESMLGAAGIDVEGVFDEARVLIQQTLRAVSNDGQIPRTFPPQALREFSRFGRSLRDDERIDFDEGTPHAATYSQAVRRILHEQAQLERFEVEMLVNGQVIGLLADKATFEFRLADNGRTVSGRFSSDEVVPDLKQYLDLSTMAPTVAINAVAITSVSGSVIEIQDVLSVEPVLPANWSGRLKEISELDDGWYDGAGERVTRQVLRQTETLLLECLDARVERPRIFPTESGGVRLEWVLNDREVIAEVERDHKISLFAFSKVDDEDEEEKIVGWSEVDEAVDFIGRRIGVSFT
jgi:hypothetical protein